MAGAASRVCLLRRTRAPHGRSRGFGEASKPTIAQQTHKLKQCNARQSREVPHRTRTRCRPRPPRPRSRCRRRLGGPGPAALRSRCRFRCRGPRPLLRGRCSQSRVRRRWHGPHPAALRGRCSRRRSLRRSHRRRAPRGRCSRRTSLRHGRRRLRNTAFGVRRRRRGRLIAFASPYVPRARRWALGTCGEAHRIKRTGHSVVV